MTSPTPGSTLDEFVGNFRLDGGKRRCRVLAYVGNNGASSAKPSLARGAHRTRKRVDGLPRLRLTSNGPR